MNRGEQNAAQLAGAFRRPAMGNTPTPYQPPDPFANARAGGYSGNLPLPAAGFVPGVSGEHNWFPQDAAAAPELAAPAAARPFSKLDQAMVSKLYGRGVSNQVAHALKMRAEGKPHVGIGEILTWGKHEGGPITDQDTVPGEEIAAADNRMPLLEGEYVMTREAVELFGMDLFERMNQVAKDTLGQNLETPSGPVAPTGGPAAQPYT